jgi:hypothetical protein
MWQSAAHNRLAVTFIRPGAPRCPADGLLLPEGQKPDEALMLARLGRHGLN